MECRELKVLVVDVLEDCAEAAWAWLDAQEGIGTVVIEEDRSKPGHLRLLAYPDAPSVLDLLEGRRGEMEAALGLGGWSDAVLGWRVRVVQREDWAESWKRHWKPIEVSRRLWLVPAWEETPDAAFAAEAVVRLDPGLGFGTGAHFTTRYCLEAVSRHVCPGVRVLDLGTGSGVLSVAAVLLGAQQPVIGVEFDRLALEAARGNAKLNEVEAGCVWLAEDLEEWEGPAAPVELVLANLYSSLLTDLIPRLKRWVCTGGHLVVSGLEGDQGPTVRKAFLAAGGWDLQDERVGGEWTGLDLLRTGRG